MKRTSYLLRISCPLIEQAIFFCVIENTTLSTAFRRNLRALAASAQVVMTMAPEARSPTHTAGNPRRTLGRNGGEVRFELTFP